MKSFHIYSENNLVEKDNVDNIHVLMIDFKQKFPKEVIVLQYFYYRNFKLRILFVLNIF